MAIKTSCPHCGQGYTLADSQEGKKVRCKGCSEPFEVWAHGPPARAEAPARRRPRDEEEDDRYADRPSRRRPRDDYDEEEDRPARRRGRREDEDEDDYDERPRPRRRQGGGIPVWVWLVGGGGVLLLVVGVVLAVVLMGNSRVSLANYDRLTPGMSESEARAILGRPSEETGGETGAFGMKIDIGKVLVWKSGDNFISATFQKDKLWAKSCKIGPVSKSQVGNANFEDVFKGLKGLGK
jgi:hypothetical protein